jgi:hypothetical protein
MDFHWDVSDPESELETCSWALGRYQIKLLFYINNSVFFSYLFLYFCHIEVIVAVMYYLTSL